MRHATLRTRAAAALVALASSLGGVAAAQGEELPMEAAADAPDLRAKVLPLRAEVRNLVLKVSDLDGGLIDARSTDRTELTLAADVLFAFDEATLDSRADSKLSEVVGIIEERAEGKVTIDGYTDSRGSEAYNLALSKRRAEAVERRLDAQLDGAVELVARGHGEADPVAPNSKGGIDNPAGRVLNRRVEIRFANASAP